VETEQCLVPAPRGLQVSVKLEPGTGLTSLGGGLSNRKRRLQAAHRAMTAGRALVPVHHKRPKGLMALMEDNWDEKEHCPVLQHVGWSRKRANEMPKMPDDPTARAEFALELADAYALRSKEKATWKAYSEWWKTYLSFCEFFDVAETNSAGRVELTYGWEESVEALRKAVALMALEYASSTIDIMVSAVGFYFNKMRDEVGRPWKPPHEEPNFKATLEGIKRDIGTRKRKQPPLEAHHVAALLEMKAPPKWSTQMWLQVQVLMLVGWELFNRRQDFSRFQPCDLRHAEGTMQVLIRYAKNDSKGNTRAPTLSANPEAPDQCPVGLMQAYCRECCISTQPGCDKVWGEPYACTVCPPLFPTILIGGKCDRSMPDSRVTVVVKRAMVALAEARPEILSVEEAQKFSAKSLRTGGTSESAAHQIREGVIQGHGGWASRKSLDHYDQMKQSEHGVVSSLLNEAISKWRTGAAPRRKQTAAAKTAAYRADVQQGLVRLGNPDVASVEVGTQGAASSDEEADYFREYKVKQLLGSRREAGEHQIEVCWEGTVEYAEHTSWQSRDSLIRDGLGQMVRELEVQQQRTEAVASATARAARTAARGSRCQ
jgi:hypothetical protein